MKPRVIRPVVSGAVLAILALTLLPVRSAFTASLSASPQNQRSRNNSASTSTKTDTYRDAAASDDVSDGSQSDKKPIDRVPVGFAASASVKPVSAIAEKSLVDEGAQSSSSGGQDTPPPRRKAPPFDRPPLVQNSGRDSNSGSSGTKSRSSSSGDSGNTSQRSGDSRYDPDQNYPDDTTDRTGRQRPELRRPTDARNDDPTSSRPVLRRPGDSEQADAQNSRGRRPSTGPGDQQSGQNQSSTDGDIIRLESTLVNIPLLVSDRAGRYIPQLTKRDFLLWEDGTPQEIASFGSEEVPFKVALLLDVSPSVAGSIDDIQEAALAFVHELRTQDEVMVVAFDRRSQFLTDFTSDRRVLESAIRSIRTGSGTSVYEAVVETVQRRFKGLEGRKALILFSDGEDTTSRHISYDDAINTVTESDVLVYGLRYPGLEMVQNRGPWPQTRIPTQLPPIFWPFPFPTPRKRGPNHFNALPNSGSPSGATGNGQWSRRMGRDFMADIATAGGGPVYDAQTVGDMRGLASRIAEELRHVYVLSYYPTNALSNGGYRSIRIQVKNRSDIAIRHRRGYSATQAHSGK